MAKTPDRKKQPWTVSRMWDGQDAAIFASGESMGPATAELVRTHAAVRVISINNNYRLAPWADLFYAGDQPWWEVHHKHVTGLAGMKACVENTRFDDVIWLNQSGADGFDPNPAFIRTGGNSGYQALHLAAHLGARRVFLFGYDMQGDHWHANHERPLRQTPPVRRIPRLPERPLRQTQREDFDRWLPRFNSLRDGLIKAGVEVFNCSPTSRLGAFPRADFADVMGGVTCERSA